MYRIQQQPIALSERAGKMIAWIHLVERPLTISKLLCALAIRDTDKYFDPNGLPIKKSLLNCCQGLALIDQETSTVRLVHYSLDEYLSRQDRIFGYTKVAWHSKIARTCLTFLQFPPKIHENQTDQSGETITLLFYATKEWGHHLRRADSSEDAPMDLAIEYLHNGLANNPNQLRLLYKAIDGSSKNRMLDGVLHAHIAAFFGSLGIMSYLISISHATLDSIVKFGFCQTPLSRAARHGHKSIVKLLLDAHSLDVDSKDTPCDHQSLYLAAMFGHEAIVALLLDSGKVDINARDENGQTPLSVATLHGHESIVKLLLDTGEAQPDLKDNTGETPLLKAAERGFESIVKRLLDFEMVNVNSRGFSGRTSLARAAYRGHEAILKLLIDTRRVDFNSKDEDGDTPIHLAIQKGHEAIVKLLLDTGRVDVHLKDRYSNTPLCIAAKLGNEAIVKLLLNSDSIDANSKDKYGRTPLIVASRNGQEAVVKLLIESGKVDIDSKDKIGRTSLSVAEESGHMEVVKLLQSYS